MDEALPPRRSKRGIPWWVTLLTFAVLAAAIGAVWYYGNVPKNGIQMAELEADAQQKIPPGSTRDDVRAWFAAHGITDFGDLRNAGGQVDGYWAIVPNDTWFEPAEINLSCRFDKDGRLTSASMYRARRR